MEQKIKKEYHLPVVRTTEIKLGVFGNYGGTPPRGGHGGGHHGGRHQGGFGGCDRWGH